ncbi:hypothetical protein Tco_0984615, partial [Tanacetum coccineum]
TNGYVYFTPIASSLEAEQDSGNITKTRSKATPNESSSLKTTSGCGPRRQETMGDTIAQTRFENVSKLSNDSLLARGNTLQSDEDRLKLNELMELCTNLQKKVLDLEKTKTTQANETASLKRRIKKLEQKKSSRTHGLKRLRKGRKINATDADEDITLVNVQDDADNEMFDVDALNGEEVFVAGQKENVVEEVVDVAQVSTATITTEEITLAQVLAALKSVKPKVKGDVIEEPSVPVSAASASTKVSAATTITATIPTPRKGIVITELGTPTITRSSQQPSQAKAKIEADHELVQRLQAEKQEELSVEEKEKLFQQLLKKRRKHFAAKRAEEQRNKPPTQAQQRKIMCTYLKNMEGKKLKDLKNKYFDSIQKMFDKAFKRQKVDEDKDTAELQSLMEVIPDEEEVAIDVVPLATKSPSIVDWKIHKEGKKSYYQIVRADGKSQMYRVFSQMLKSFTGEDLEDLYKMVKAKYESTRPVEDLALVLWNDFSALLEFVIWNDLHAGRKEISPYTTYNYRYAEQKASG